MTRGSEKREHPGESRYPAAAAIVVAIVLYAVLPSALVVGPRYLVPALELVLLVPLLVGNPRRMTRTCSGSTTAPRSRSAVTGGREPCPTGSRSSATAGWRARC